MIVQCEKGLKMQRMTKTDKKHKVIHVCRAENKYFSLEAF